MATVQRLRALLAGDVGTTLFFGLLLAALAWLIFLGVRNPASLGQTLVFGIADGCIFALVALGYTMVYGIIELINFAHGDIFTLAAFTSVTIFAWFGIEGPRPFGVGVFLTILLVLAIVMLINGLVNITIERIAYRPLRNAPKLAPLITAIGMSFILEGLMFIWKGPFNVIYPDLLPRSHVLLAGVRVTAKDAIVIGFAVVLVVALSVFINTTKLGKAMRATAQDRDAAQLMGIDINRTISATFFIGAMLAAAGGIIWGLYFNTVRFDLGFAAGLVAFTAAVFGGIGNIQGAALGGLLIGIIRVLSEAYVHVPGWDPDIAIFVVLIMVLVFRPTGLLGMRVPEK